MTAYTQDGYDGVLARFYGFCDGVIRTVLLQFDENGTRSVEVHVAIRDSETDENEGWVCVRIVVRGVSDFGVRESSRTPIQVLSQGIHLLCVANRVGIEFGGAIDRPESFEAFHSSDGFAIGRDVEFYVEAY
ncbi:hypothetical protein DTL42_17915 [Bremerella cremea]|uniref:Uncharacterized protein n=1 Tax=Bremerella cremea TaxID=1031537 RepID=A0A368KQ62_9BACT|nr:hypothetical protein [Bremerella cremea]RCS44188.1 hypothetical protein DTL42_17915 [Bremerella cremea]